MLSRDHLEKLKKRERETYPPARFRKWRNNLSERKEEKNRRPNGFTGRQKTIVGGREIILQREPAIRPGLRGGGGEGGEIKGRGTNKARLPFVMPVNDAMPDEPL